MPLRFWNIWAISKEFKIALVNKPNDEVTDVWCAYWESLPGWSTWCRKGGQLKNTRPKTLVRSSFWCGSGRENEKEAMAVPWLRIS